MSPEISKVYVIVSSTILQFALLRDCAVRDLAILAFSEVLEVFSQVFQLLPNGTHITQAHTCTHKVHENSKYVCVCVCFPALVCRCECMYGV